MYCALLIADGFGEALRSKRTAALHEVCFRPLIGWAASAAGGAAQRLVVTKDEGASFTEGERALLQKRDESLSGCLLRKQEAFLSFGDVLLLECSMPLLTRETVEDALAYHRTAGNEITFFLAQGEKVPALICKKDTLLTLLGQAKDAAQVSQLLPLLSSYKNGAYPVQNPEEFQSIHNRSQLALAEQAMRKRLVSRHMREGVTFLAPETAYIGADCVIGKDTIIMPNCIIRDASVIGEDCVIGPDTSLSACRVGDGAELVRTVAVQSSIGEAAHTGPFAYIRPGSVIGKKAKIGDFVEVKNAVIGEGSKASHLTYIGDADVGAGVNFGCGTILVNYDGKKKHRSVVGDGAFIGCNTNLVSPVRVGEGAFIAAGSTITQDVPAGGFAIARERQTNKTDWKRK